jgi:hypothetical protein
MMMTMTIAAPAVVESPERLASIFMQATFLLCLYH